MKLNDHLQRRFGLKSHLTRRCGKFGLDSIGRNFGYLTEPVSGSIGASFGESMTGFFNGESSFIELGYRGSTSGNHWNSLIGEKPTTRKKFTLSAWVSMKYEFLLLLLKGY